MVPWEQIPINQIEDQPGQFNKLLNRLKAMKITISMGLRDNYLLVSLGVRRGRFSAWFSEDFTPGSNPHSVLTWLWVSNAPDVVIGVAFTQPL